MPLMWVYEWTETIQAEYIQSLAMKMESVSEKKKSLCAGFCKLKDHYISNSGNIGFSLIVQ
jgi:hypothetical protein